MYKVHQNTKWVFVEGLKLLHNVYLDQNIFCALQKRIEDIRLNQQNCRIKLLQLSTNGQLQISRQASQYFTSDSLYNIRKAVQNYLKASAEMIMQLDRIDIKLQSEMSFFSIKQQNLQKSALENEQSLKMGSEQKERNCNEQFHIQNVDSQQINLQGINLQIEQSSGLQSSTNKSNLHLENRNHNQIQTNLYNTNKTSSQKQLIHKEPKRKNLALNQKQLAQLQMDLKQPNFNKKYLQQKYRISQSTINRYIRRLKLKQQLPQFTIKNTFYPQYKLKQSLNNTQSQADTIYAPKSQLIGRKNSKVRLIEPKLLQIYRQNPQIYQSEAAQILSNFYKQQISTHVVSRCLKNIAKKKQLMNSIKHSEKETNPLNKCHKAQQNPVFVQNRFQFAKEFIGRDLKKLIYIDQGIYKKRKNGDNEQLKTQEVHFALALANNGKVVHWKLKTHSFKPTQIAIFIQQIWLKFQDHTLLLDNSHLHRLQPIRNVIKQKRINHLYIPPYSSQLNPIQSILPYFIPSFDENLTENLDSHQTLRLAHFTIMKVKENIFSKEIASARYFVDVAYRKQPFSIKYELSQKHNLDNYI